jgi:chemotaxis protein CheD
MEKELKVGIGDMKFTRGEGRIITYALGSCIGISFYDPAIKLGALLHIMLPERQSPTDSSLFKYADTGIQETLRKLRAFGMMKSRMVVKIAGGAKMCAIQGNASFGNIGERNAAKVKQILREEGLRLVAEDTGGTYARTMVVDVTTGKVTIKSFGKPEKYL